MAAGLVAGLAAGIGAGALPDGAALLRWAGVLVCRTWVRTVVDGTGRALLLAAEPAAGLLAGAGTAEGLATDLAADVAAMAGRAAISALLP